MTVKIHTQPVTIARCPRCHETHRDLVIRPLGKPMGEFPGWGICPLTLEPIMARVSHDEPMYRREDVAKTKRADIPVVRFLEFV